MTKKKIYEKRERRRKKKKGKRDGFALGFSSMMSFGRLDAT